MSMVPLLDLLIPAYEHPEGLLRILNSLIHAPHEVRIVVNDDSTTTQVEDCLKGHVLAQRVIYHRNQPSLGAIPNWNALLAKSNAPYAMVLHHDECPMKDDFWDVLVNKLRTAPDMVMVDLWVPGIWPGTVRLHTPRRLRRWIVNRFPAYLLRRNVLGPPSVIVLKESLRAPFDPRIPWMVDVEWYHRILCVGGYKVHSLDGAALVHTGHGHSISQSMEGTPSQRRCKESRILLESGHRSSVLRLNAGSSFGFRFLAAFETMAWMVVRVYHRISLGLFRFQSLPQHLRKVL
ncbi:MAG: glycosyltransferase family 2 protein [Bacteroidetes bacterium]|nr:glycosyltransferase family 2 protein [Bacteroidota bacterium]